MYLILFSYLIVNLSANPINLVQKATENDFELDNYLPKENEFPKFHYDTFGKSTESDDRINKIDFKSSERDKPKSLGEVSDFVKEGAAAGMDLLLDIGNMFKSTLKPEIASERQTTTLPIETTTELEVTTLDLSKKNQLDPVKLDDNGNNTANRTIRQEETDEKNDPEFDDTPSKDTTEKESQEDEEEEEEPNMITGLISAFLGGLSRPDGSVDVEAITGLLGSLSSQKEDGSYDFNGLTDLLMSFFGGGGEEGGGSDFGAFLGGLAGAFIKGVAKPPGAKGAGVFVGNLLGGVLPGLSAPAPTEEGQPQKPQPQLDSGGFLGGLLSSVFGNLGGLSNSGGGDDAAGGGGNKFSLFKAVFSIITSIFSSSSAAH